MPLLDTIRFTPSSRAALIVAAKRSSTCSSRCHVRGGSSTVRLTGIVAVSSATRSLVLIDGHWFGRHTTVPPPSAWATVQM